MDLRQNLWVGCRARWHDQPVQRARWGYPQQGLGAPRGLRGSNGIRLRARRHSFKDWGGRRNAQAGARETAGF